jgi:hypothetical protein
MRTPSVVDHLLGNNVLDVNTKPLGKIKDPNQCIGKFDGETTRLIVSVTKFRGR